MFDLFSVIVHFKFVYVDLTFNLAVSSVNKLTQATFTQQKVNPIITVSKGNDPTFQLFGKIPFWMKLASCRPSTYFDVNTSQPIGRTGHSAECLGRLMTMGKHLKDFDS